MPPKYDFYIGHRNTISFSKAAEYDEFPASLLEPIKSIIQTVDVSPVTKEPNTPWIFAWDVVSNRGFSAEELYTKRLFPHQLFLKQFEAQFADIANIINSNEPELVAQTFYDSFFSAEDLRSCGRTVIRDQIKQACIQWLVAKFDISKVFGEV